MNIKLVFLTALLILSLSNPVFGANYSKEEIEKMGGKLIELTVQTVKVYNFFGKTDSGQILNIVTDKETKFIPQDERLYAGDRVLVALFEPFDASGSTSTTMAYSIEFINIEPRNFLKSPKVGIYSLYNDRSADGVYFEDINKLVKIEGLKQKSDLHDVHMFPGKKYELFFEVVPAKIGNGYVYVAINAKKVAGENYPQQE